jgi:hypothetical protein
LLRQPQQPAPATQTFAQVQVDVIAHVHTFQ